MEGKQPMPSHWSTNDIRDEMDESERQAVAVIVNILKHDEFFPNYQAIIRVVKDDMLGWESLMEDEQTANNKYEGEYGSQFI